MRIDNPISFLHKQSDIKELYRQKDKVKILSIQQENIPITPIKTIVQSIDVLNLTSIIEHFQHIDIKPGCQILKEERYNPDSSIYEPIRIFIRNPQGKEIPLDLQNMHKKISVDFIKHDHSPEAYWEMYLFWISLSRYTNPEKLDIWETQKILLPTTHSKTLSELYPSYHRDFPDHDKDFHLLNQNFFDHFIWRTTPNLFLPHLVTRNKNTYLRFYTMDIKKRATLKHHYVHFDLSHLYIRSRQDIVAYGDFGMDTMANNTFLYYYPDKFTEIQHKPWDHLPKQNREAEEQYHHRLPYSWVTPNEKVEIVPIESVSPFRSLPSQKILEDTETQLHYYLFENIPDLFPHLQFDPDYRLCGIRVERGDPTGLVIAVHKDANIPMLTPAQKKLYIDNKIPLKLDGVKLPQEVLEGDTSLLSIWERVIFYNSIEEFTVGWHTNYWAHRSLLPLKGKVMKTMFKHAPLMENDYVNLKSPHNFRNLASTRDFALSRNYSYWYSRVDWIGENPSIWHPHMIKRSDEIKIIFYTELMGDSIEKWTYRFLSDWKLELHKKKEVQGEFRQNNISRSPLVDILSNIKKRQPR